jgi:hypothetical protein
MAQRGKAAKPKSSKKKGKKCSGAHSRILRLGGKGLGGLSIAAFAKKNNIALRTAFRHGALKTASSVEKLARNHGALRKTMGILLARRVTRVREVGFEETHAFLSTKGRWKDVGYASRDDIPSRSTFLRHLKSIGFASKASRTRERRGRQRRGEWALEKDVPWVPPKY